MIATLGKVGTGFDLANEKRYDAWGAVRSGSGAGSHIVNPNTGYCANLGHKFDGESDLLYMRARFYEPSTGRFISEDSARDGANWYVYCENDPIQSIDQSGKAGMLDSAPQYGFAIAFFFYFVSRFDDSKSTLYNASVFLIAIAGSYYTYWLNSKSGFNYLRAIGKQWIRSFGYMVGRESEGMAGYQFGLAMVVTGFYVGYSLFLAFACDLLQNWVNDTTQ